MVPGLRTVSELNDRSHWAVRNRRKNDQQEQVAVAMLNALRGRKIELPCVVKLTRVGPKKMDNDNLAGAMKHCQDQIARRCGDRSIERCAAAGFPFEDVSQRRWKRRCGPGDHACRVVGRVVVADHDLPRASRSQLRKACQRLLELRRPIVRGDDDRISHVQRPTGADSPALRWTGR